MKRIGLAGFLHETNTFSSQPTTLQDFINADGLPALTRGKDFFNTFIDNNIPTSGFLASTEHESCVPILWANACPAGKVTQQAFETICDKIIDGIKNSGQLDGLYLDLHGAMVCEHVDDGEGELLKRIRHITGPDFPIVASHDLHANVSDATFALTNVIVSYCTYPHIDMVENGVRAAQALQAMVYDDRRFHKAMHRFGFLIPLTTQCSLIAPAKQIYQTLTELEKQYSVLLSFNTCFPASDTSYTGPTVLAYGENKKNVHDALNALVAFIEKHKHQFHSSLYSEQAAVDYYLQKKSNQPMIFADTQDNPGCGGISNTMGIFNVLVKNKITNAAVAIVADAKAIKILQRYQVGDEVELALGDHFHGKFILEKLTDGKFIGTGPFYLGCHIDLGGMALLNHNGIRVLVSSRALQAADQAAFVHLGLNPSDFSLLVLKSSVHFRADFTDLASEIIIVESPGENTADLNSLTFIHCPLKPLDDGMST